VTHTQTYPKVELLAPAGNMECLHAAIDAGADAVYLGLDEFNARRNADNFTQDTLAEACAYAHLRNARIYVTLNIEILPSEYNHALDVARRAWRAGADAFIVQDLGLARAIAREFPSGALHVSTQMNVHNAAGIEAAAELGAGRVTLARELSLSEIAALSQVARDFGMDVEVFTHGALCICYSGQCLMSSMIGGRSANRGLCAQACRLPYELHDDRTDGPLPAPGEHLLSPRDLCTVDLLPQLVEAGVSSLKVEGRMKSADYVHTVIGVYRDVLDRTLAAEAERAAAAAEAETEAEHTAAAAGAEADVAAAGESASADDTASAGSTADQSASAPAEAAADAASAVASAAAADSEFAGSSSAAPAPAVDVKATDEQRSSLAEAFSRGFTTAYLTGDRGNDIMSYGRPNNRGVFVGRVAAARPGEIEIAPERPLHAGDTVEIWTNRGHFACPVNELVPGRKGTVKLAVDQRVSKGDRVFRVRNAAEAFEDDPFEPRLPVIGTVVLHQGEPARMSFELASCRRYAPAGAPTGVTPEARAAADAPASAAAASAGAPAPTTENVADERSAGNGASAPAAPRGCGIVGSATGAVVEAARTRALDADGVAEHVDRMGQTPFHLVDLSIDLDEGVGMGFSQVHHLRAQALDDLQAQLLAPWADRPAFPLPPRAAGARTGSRLGARPSRDDVKVFAWATNPACARAAKRAGADAVYVPILNYKRGQAQLAGVRLQEAEQAGYPKQRVMALPTIDHDPHPGTREYALSFDPWDYVREDKPVFCDSLGSIMRARAAGARIEVGPHVPLTNPAALEQVASWGAERVWLSPELTLGQIADLGERTPVPLGLTIIGAQELMICEHCLLMSQGPCNEQCETCPRRSREHFYTDRKEFDFPVVTDALGRGHLYNGVQLDIAHSLPDLVDAGVTAFMVDTTLLDKPQAAEMTARAVRARALLFDENRAIEKRRGTTSGHLFRGVS
jgi:putative protease